VRPAWWNEQDYVDQWLHWTQSIKAAMGKPCPDLVTEQNYKYYAPSFAGTDNSLNPIITWKDGLNTDKDISFIDSHK